MIVHCGSNLGLSESFAWQGRRGESGRAAARGLPGEAGPKGEAGIMGPSGEKGECVEDTLSCREGGLKTQKC